jgi:hypothetical protein
MQKLMERKVYYPTQEARSKQSPYAITAERAMAATFSAHPRVSTSPAIRAHLANSLTDQRFPLRQRHGMATRLDHSHGNFYWQQVLMQARQNLAFVQRQHDAGVSAGVPLATTASTAAVSASAAPIPPELLTSVNLDALSDAQLRVRQELIQQTLLQRRESSTTTQILQQESTRIEQLLAERRVDAVVRGELESFLREFSNITVTVRWVENTETQCVERSRPVVVHPPYFMNVHDRTQAAPRTLQRYDTAQANRGAANRATQRFLRSIGQTPERGGMGLSRANVGKSRPEDIQRILQSALDQNLIQPPAGPERPNSDDLRNWLVRYGIGVDCSAFVSQALNRVTAHVLDRPLAENEQIDRGSTALRGGANGFTLIPDPRQLRPGDTMHIPGHIRIVTSVGRTAEGDFTFTTAESRSGGQADVGPDRAEWRYHNRQLQLRRPGADPWSDVGEAPTYGRYDRLRQAMREAAAR